MIDQGYKGEELNSLMKAMDEVDITYMVNALNWIKSNYGSVKAYITQELDVTETEIEQLQDRYLITAHPAKKETCTEPGNTAYWTCAGRYFSDAQGTKEIDKDSVVIRAKGHTSVKDPAVAPTHTSTGLTEGSHCSVCGATIKKQEVVQKLAKDPQPMTVKAAKKKTVKVSKLKKKKQVISPITVKAAQGAVTYKITGGNKKSKKALKISKNTGKITVKKKTKKGTYKVKVTVKAAGNENYNAGSKTVDVKVVVK